MPADDLTLLRTVAAEAGDLAMRYFRQDPHVWYKNDTSPVSEADLAVDRFLRDRLMTARPEYGWLSEETEDDRSRLGDRPTFVVDPIDGTRAFLKGEVWWCVSVAVVRAGRSVAGVLACPANGELYAADSASPSCKNGRPIRVADPDRVKTMAAPRRVLAKLPEDFLGLERQPHVASLAYRLAMVADGRLTATLVKPNSSDWDLAAADVVLSQAGGAIVDIDGAPLRYNRGDTTHGLLIAAPLALLPQLREAVSGIDL